MDELKARKIAAVRDWIDAWNAHDVERVLGHYAENVVLVAEGVRTRLGRADATARGKDELRDHFRLGLARDPELHFELEALFFSPAGYAVAYRRSVARRSLDVVEWDEAGLARSIVVFDDDARQG
jgi:hypothetical protein